MAYYGIASAGIAVTASNDGDVIQLGPSQTNLESSTTLGADGNDVIYLGALGVTATASAYAQEVLNGSGEAQLRSAYSGGTLTISGSLKGSATYQSGKSFTTAGATTGFTVSGSIDVVGVVTSRQAARTLASTQLFGNAGNDSIYLGGSLTSIAIASIGGGAGDDVIGTYNFVNNVLSDGSASGTITAFTVEGGGGNDTITFNGSADIFGSTVQGSNGNDSIIIDFDSLNAVIVAGGGGNDIISVSADSATAATVAGGGGNDTVTVSATLIRDSFIGGDVAGQDVSIYDGDDLLTITMSTNSTANTVFGGGGSDTIYLDQQGAGNLSIAGNGGNDVIRVSGNIASSSVFGGAGNDSITIASGVAGTSSIVGGGGNDTISFGRQGTGTNFATTVGVIGGADADLFSFTAGAPISGSVAAQFQYSSYSDSVLGAADTVSLTAASGQTYTLNYLPGGLTRAANFNGSAISGTDGIVTFSATVYNDLTSRVAAINANVTTIGSVVLFKDSSNIAYVFAQGGTQDLLVQLGSDGLATAGTLTITDVAGQSIISAVIVGNAA